MYRQIRDAEIGQAQSSIYYPIGKGVLTGNENTIFSGPICIWTLGRREVGNGTSKMRLAIYLERKNNGRRRETKRGSEREREREREREGWREGVREEENG